MAAAPAKPAEYEFEWGPTLAVQGGPMPSTRPSPDFSPPLIAMVAVLGTAFVIVLYARLLSHLLRRLRRRWRRWWLHRRRPVISSASHSDIESLPRLGLDDYFLPPYGLDDSAIKMIPLSLYSKAKGKQFARECAVCLLQFEESDSLRTLQACAHSFHADCIDAWLRAHATCPLCRAAVFHPDSPLPFVPMRAARIRPSLDDFLLDPPLDPDPEIVPAATSPPQVEDCVSGRDFLLKRSYSFGFERNLAAERMVLEPSTASPWRYRQRNFWSKRWPSPFGVGTGGGSSSASRSVRVFSFRSCRGIGVKSPFMRRLGFIPLSSEPSVRLGGVGLSSRRTRSLASPARLWGAAAAGFSSSRMRCGDPEALLSPERLNRR